MFLTCTGFLIARDETRYAGAAEKNERMSGERDTYAVKNVNPSLFSLVAVSLFFSSIFLHHHMRARRRGGSVIRAISRRR